MFQGTMTGIQGGNFWRGFSSGAIASLAASIIEESIGKIKEEVAFRRGADKLGIEGSNPGLQNYHHFLTSQAVELTEMPFF